jgi:hypothetical protein
MSPTRKILHKYLSTTSTSDSSKKSRQIALNKLREATKKAISKYVFEVEDDHPSFSKQKRLILEF